MGKPDQRQYAVYKFNKDEQKCSRFLDLTGQAATPAAEALREGECGHGGVHLPPEHEAARARARCCQEAQAAPPPRASGAAPSLSRASGAPKLRQICFLTFFLFSKRVSMIS